jgi:ABC-type multidrug transport system ATPase subunit
VRELTVERARQGTAVLSATQRLEELVSFAQRVTALDRGRIVFAGSVASLAAIGGADRHLLRLGPATTAPLSALDAALGALGRVRPAPGEDGTHVLLTLTPGVSLGQALTALVGAGAEMLSCRDERPPIERAFGAVTRDAASASSPPRRARSPRSFAASS